MSCKDTTNVREVQGGSQVVREDGRCGGQRTGWSEMGGGRQAEGGGMGERVGRLDR